MKRIIVVFYFSLALIACLPAQSATESDCGRNIEEILKLLKFKNRYESIQYIYKHKHTVFSQNESFQKEGFLNSFFQSVKGVPYSSPRAQSAPTISSGVMVKVKSMSEEEMEKYLERLNYTPVDAERDYKEFILTIRLNKERHLACIDAELEKGKQSEFAQKSVHYDFKAPLSSLFLSRISQLDFLDVVKGFILEGDNVLLPDFSSGTTYLKNSEL
ncbi:MAG: hypothetical protein GXZ19_13760 [Bacteroidales bacterium]|nr:hypothetical protein [Bacteroidales bacterium]